MSRGTLIRIDRPDFDTLRAEAGAVVAAELGRIASPEERARRAAQIMAEADDQIDAIKPKRDAAALSVWAYEYAMSLEQSMGIRKNAWVKSQRKALGLAPGDALPVGEARAAAARAAGIEHLPDAAVTLPRVSQDLERVRARRKEAQAFRNAALLVLREEPYSWTQQRIAQVIGKSRTLVTEIFKAA